MSYREVMDRVADAADRSGRKVSDITLVAVSKTKSVRDIETIFGLGHRDFGENRAQEMSEKAPQLPSEIRWHFVGALQSNKARLVRPIAHLLHSMDRSSLAGAWMKGIGTPPPVLIQVNVGNEAQKSGLMPEEVPEIVTRMIELGLDVRGLMAIPPVPASPADSRPHFVALRELRDRIAADHPGLSELSMGMTDDFEIAIEEGASIIRVGRAIFGARN